MSKSKILKIITGALEGLLAIPIVGGSIILAGFYIPLAVMFVLHLISLILASKENKSITGNVLGLITSIAGVIPFLGWAMHLATAIVLTVEAVKEKS